MRFREAQRELAKIANGEYHLVAKEITDPGDGGKPKVKCSVYIHGQEYHNGETWEEAIASLKDAIANQKPKMPASKQTPDSEECF